MKNHRVTTAALVLAVMTGAVPSGAGAAPGPSSVKIGASFVVEPPMARYVAELDPRELREQVRDWAVLATVTRLGATPDEAAAATYELPPARLPYLDELYAFEYGRGRRVYLGSRILLFRDADDPDPQATIGRLADRVREESGAIPAKVEVYLVHDQRDEGLIRIARAPDVTGKELFSPAYGYVEGKAGSEAELAAWLAKADDLTFTQLRDGRLVIGGRRFAKTRTANLTAEDVAALYQAHEQLGGPQLAARKTLRALPQEAQQTAAQIVELAQAGKSDEVNEAGRRFFEQSRPTSREEWERLKEAVFASASPVRGPGFSLDPEWLPDPADPAQPLMLTRMRAFAADPCGAIADIVKRAAALERAEPDPMRRTSPTRRALELRDFYAANGPKLDRGAVCRALKSFAPELDKTIVAIDAAVSSSWETALVKYYLLKDALSAMARRDPQRSLPIGLMYEALRYYEADTRAQCARYEGTAGTEVGMTMFYTDLLAKLWMGTDYGLSAPTLAIPGFVSQPRLSLSQQLVESTGGHKATRIWFGPRASGVSRVGSAGSSILFDHAFARIYAAGTNPTMPGIEERPDEFSRRAIGWWDRHYDAIADHEQEFHKLNQIMKWSLVTGALLDSETAPYLGLVRVSRTHDFDGWYRANQSRLRFSGSIPAGPQRGKECLPVFESYEYQFGDETWSISGGVGAASRASLPRVPVVDLGKPLGARKPPAPNLSGDRTGTAVRPAPRQDGKQVVFDRSDGVPTRDGKGDVALGTPKVTFKAGAKRGALAVHAGDPARQIGVVTVEPTATKVKMSWSDGTVEASRHGAVKLAKDLPEADRLARSGDVVGAASAYETATAKTMPLTALDRAREVVSHAAHRRPAALLRAVDDIAMSGARLSPEVQQMLGGAAQQVATPGATSHIKHALSHGLPLANNLGKLAVERGQVVRVRDVKAMDVVEMQVPPATDLSGRHVYIDSRLRIGQEGLLPDTGGPAARWQQRPDVRMEVLRHHPMGPLPDVINVTSTGARFDYVAPSSSAANRMLPPIVIRAGDNHGCDDRALTPVTSDDCAKQR